MRAIVVGALGLGALGFGSLGCPASTCPYPGATALTITPPKPCLNAKLSSCVHPSIQLRNDCPDALYLPRDYAQPTADGAATGEEEVLPGRSYTFEIREDKATARSKSREDFSVPARLGAETITFTFSTLGE